MSGFPRAKAERFRALHAGPDVLVVPNPWDAGSARLLAHLGFQALATSSFNSAGSLGRRDGQLTRGEALAQAEAIVRATDLPVSADLENGFGDAPQAVEETIREAAARGLVGGSIEDAPPNAAPYDFSHALERVAAAVAAARTLGFVLTARAENFTRRKPDLEDTIRRLQAYEEAGADVLFAPGVSDLGAIRTICRALRKPVNVVAGAQASVADFAQAGVRRISLATALYRAALTSLSEAATEVRDRGTFTFASRGMTSAEVTGIMGLRP